MDRIGYYLLKFAFATLARLPWWLLHGLCRTVAFLLDQGIGYRRGVVRSNLQRSFPEKSTEELRQIERDFYRQFAYNFLSTPKLLHQRPNRIASEYLIFPDHSPLEEATKR